MKKKIILHLCADIGSDSIYYQLDSNYDVILIGESIGVENYEPPDNVHGIIANPVCTEFSTASGFHHIRDYDKGMFLVNHCIRIIEKSNPVWWVLENPSNGRLVNFLGEPIMKYQPWEYGSPWTKKTSLWGSFTIPKKLYTNWSDVPKNDNLYIRPGRKKPSLAFLHKSAIDYIDEFKWAKNYIKNDSDFRSLCSDGFAKAFYLVNK
jgi:hypothetical protein